MVETAMLFNPLDRDDLRRRIRQSEPVPNICIDNFLEESFAERVLGSFPSFDESLKVGKQFKAVNEMNKVQVTDSQTFAEPVAQLNRALASPEFLDLLSYAFDIPDLLADDELVGGGIHQTGPRGHLDVHVDFNYIPERQLHRRLNILIYFNKDWQDAWGGRIELWDKDVKVCRHSFSPIFNRCVIFETNEISFHGVTAVHCPPGVSRKSFAAYFYTTQAPAHWTGEAHSTIFRARPDEIVKGTLLMPAEKTARWVLQKVRSLKQRALGKSSKS
jgi:Rps23 Pro-64 3,4-dihydroxylase Tpa1-like proline 4-hydroxylase